MMNIVEELISDFEIQNEYDKLSKKLYELLQNENEYEFICERLEKFLPYFRDIEEIKLLHLILRKIENFNSNSNIIVRLVNVCKTNEELVRVLKVILF